MVSFNNSTSRRVIISYWVNCLMSDIYIEPGEIINVDNCTVGEWIYLLQNIKE